MMVVWLHDLWFIALVAFIYLLPWWPLFIALVAFYGNSLEQY